MRRGWRLLRFTSLTLVAISVPLDSARRTSLEGMAITGVLARSRMRQGARLPLVGALALTLLAGGLVACSPDPSGEDSTESGDSPSSAAQPSDSPASRTPKPAVSDAPGRATSEPDFSATPSEPPSPSETPPPQGLTSPGLVPKDIGELGGIGPVNSGPEEWQLSHKVLDIQWDPTCSASPGLKPTQGAFLAVKMEVTQFHDRSMTDLELGHKNWNPIGPDGVAAVGSPSTASGCLPVAERLPTVVEWDADTVTGWIVLDVPTDTARISLTSWGDPNNGWIWDVPAR